MPRPIPNGTGVCLGWSERDLALANTDNGPKLPEGAITGIKKYIDSSNQGRWLGGIIHITTCGQMVVGAWIKPYPINVTCLECMST